MMVSHAPWDEWIVAFERVHADPAIIGRVECPTCGARTLRIVYTADADDRVGYASFWCDTSMDGIFTSRIEVPSGVPIIPFGLPPEERARCVPNYAIIPPAAADGEDDIAFTI
jgi:hypothetical protein